MEDILHNIKVNLYENLLTEKRRRSLITSELLPVFKRLKTFCGDDNVNRCLPADTRKGKGGRLIL